MNILFRNILEADSGISLPSETASRALQLSAGGLIQASGVSNTELSYLIGVTSAIQTQLNSKASSTLTSAHIFVGNGSNVATDVAVSGDLTLANTGAFTIANSAVTNAKLANMADQTFKANNSGGSAAPQDVTAANVKTMLNLSGTNSGDVTLTAFGASPSSSGASLSGQALTLQPCDATNPGGISTAAQTIPGIKTFSSAPVMPAGSVGTPGINFSDANTGLYRSAANQIAVSTNGAVNSVFSSSGLLVQAALLVGTSVTANILSSDDASVATAGTIRLGNAQAITWRNAAHSANISLVLDATNVFQLGSALNISGNITASNLSGTNSGDVTLTAVGGTPNANGASLSGQALTLQPANASFPGVLLAADWSTFNNKLSSALTSAHIFVGNGSNVATDVAVSGDIAITNAGVTSYSGVVPVSKSTVAASAIAASNIDWSLSNMHTKTLGANTTFTFSNAISGQAMVVRLTNTASNYTVTWPSVQWMGGTPPTMTIGAFSDVYTFIFDGTNYFGSAVQNFS